jgi:FkbM family methyltransferase
MSGYPSAEHLAGHELVAGSSYKLPIMLPDAETCEVCFRFDPHGTIDPEQGLLLRDGARLTVLRQIARYPAMLRLLQGAAIPCDYSVLERQVGDEVYIFGAHQVGVLLARLFQARGGRVRAFLDNDERKHGAIIEGIPVQGFDRSTMAPGALVVLGSGRYSETIRVDLATKSWINVMTMQAFLAAIDAPYITEDSFRNYHSVLFNQASAFVSAFLCLEDERSREVYDGLIRMRLELDNAAASIRSDFRLEYIEPDFIEAQDIRFYVDAGAYDGDTLARLESRLGAAQNAYLFEPEQRAFEACQRRFADRKTVKVLQAAMSETPCWIPAPRANSCDVLGQLAAGDVQPMADVAGLPLDEVAVGAVSLIKLDIEGAEGSALRGARQVLLRERPKLCVCAYHRSDDLWRLINTVLALRGDYRVGVRHYSDIIDDTTLYFY